MLHTDHYVIIMYGERAAKEELELLNMEILKNPDSCGFYAFLVQDD
jgi:hypothetical protein